MFKKEKKEESIADLVKNARKEKHMSARKLAELCTVSHTEINNIESGIRYKPSILVLKGFEKYLDLPFSKTAKMVGYSDETIKYGSDDIVVSYEMYDKKIDEFREELKHIHNIMDLKNHTAGEIQDMYKPILEYLKSQNNVDNKLLKDAEEINRLLDYIKMKYDYPLKEK